MPRSGYLWVHDYNDDDDDDRDRVLSSGPPPWQPTTPLP